MNACTKAKPIAPAGKSMRCAFQGRAGALDFFNGLARGRWTANAAMRSYERTGPRAGVPKGKDRK